MPALTRVLRRARSSGNIEANWVQLDPLEWELATSATPLPLASGLSGDFCRMGAALSEAVHHGLSSANSLLQEHVSRLDPSSGLLGTSAHHGEPKPLNAFALANSIASAIAFAPDPGSSAHHNEANVPPGQRAGSLPHDDSSCSIRRKPVLVSVEDRACEGRIEPLSTASQKGHPIPSAPDSEGPSAGDQQYAGEPEDVNEIATPTTPSSTHGLIGSPISPSVDSRLQDYSHLIEEAQSSRMLETIFEDDDDSSSCEDGPSSPLSMSSQFTECSFHTAKGISDLPASVRLQLIPSYPD